MLVSALCGSLREGSYNQALLNTAIERGPRHGLEIVQGDISRFPLFSQELEKVGYPADVLAVKQLIQSSACLMLSTPEHNWGVPGVLKNAIDLLSRPYRDPTLWNRPLALMGATTGIAGTVRAQLAWRQTWAFFNAPVYSGSEVIVSRAATVFDATGKLTDDATLKVLDAYLDGLAGWLAGLHW